MPSILTLYYDDDWKNEEPIATAHLAGLYYVWSQIARKRGYTLTAASSQWFAKGSFTKYWRLRRDMTWEKVRRPLRPRVCYDRSANFDLQGRIIDQVFTLQYAVRQAVPVVNVPEFSHLVDNKLYQAALFGDLMPPTKLGPVSQVLRNPRRKRVVIKSLGGSSGLFVQITDAARIRVPRGHVVQEFINTQERNGQRQDFRIYYVGKTPQYCQTHITRPGSLFTNVRYGATHQLVSLSSVPQLVQAGRKVLAALELFPKKFVALDFMLEHKTRRPYLIEANTLPGLSGLPQALQHRVLTNMTNLLLS